ncbi:hypothetical protein M9Y10_024494 [Tritrichomonas musculus]|uniref:F5/8 type C domain-containing protein n=1 Tax=Tritrichomonas musculus TaxID=1915356 RepID=A0ABR2HEE5_9EUKA
MISLLIASSTTSTNKQTTKLKKKLISLVHLVMISKVIRQLMFQYLKIKTNIFGHKINQTVGFVYTSKNHQVIPTYYTIRTNGSNTNSHPKSWVIEGSNDDSSWTNLDTQNESPHLLKGWIVHTFNINNSNSYKYIRMRKTGKSKNNNVSLLIDSFEIYGTLI